MPPMSADAQTHSLLEELDRMQDEVLLGLDDLDARILGLIKACSAASERNLKLAAPGEELSEAA
jgi:hypothetical protein